jgi:FAD dependent oxidoreductase TIGR03364
MQRADLLIVGAGVLGTFHALQALQCGFSVILLEKDLAPQDATVRNFGMVVPSGMAQGQWQKYGITSTQLYKDIQAQFDIGVRQQGSVYIASDRDELGLLEELHEINQHNDYPSLLLSQDACLATYPALRRSYCVGGLVFPDEVTVEPRYMIHRLIAYLQEQFALCYQPLAHAVACEVILQGVRVEDTQGRAYLADKVIICSGREFKSLYPQIFYGSDIEVVKLQMMQTYPLADVPLKSSLLTGLTIRRYESFQECPSYATIARRRPLNPQLLQWGIHMLFKQAVDGSIIIGDSHEYRDARDADALGFDLHSDIYALLLHEAQRILHLPSWDIARMWAGFYALT